MTESYTAFDIVNPAGNPHLLLVADHASNTTPAGYGTLGLPAEDFERHIAFDIGVEGLTRALANRLDCPAVLSRFSRLLIDPNRGEDDPTLIMKLSDGAIIPGNRHVDAAETEHRLSLCYRPYHHAIDRVIARAEAEIGHGPAIVSIHSFVKQLQGRPPRPWHVGVLYDWDRDTAQAFFDSLSAESDLCVGDNQPYTGHLTGDCMWRHATQRQLPHALLEVRNDLIETRAAQQNWADRLTPHIASVFGARA